MIKLIQEKINHQDLLALCTAHFESMVKFVVDVDQEILAAGGEMHADAEDLLLQQGSKQSHLWGGNFYPWNDPKNRLEYTSFINIRPMDDNMSMEVTDPGIQGKIRSIAETLLLSPDEILQSDR